MREVNQSENPEEYFVLSNTWEEKGMEKGMEKGIEKGKRDMVLELLKEDIPIETIIKASHLSEEEIQKLMDYL